MTIPIILIIAYRHKAPHPGGGPSPTDPECPPGTGGGGGNPPITVEAVRGRIVVRFVDPGTGGGGGDNPCTPIPPLIVEIKNKVKNPCLKKMVDATISANVNNEINSLIQSVFGESTKMNLEYLDVTTLPNWADGKTEPNGGIINGVLNAQVLLNVNFLQNYSQQYIARVIMHESLHAYLISKGREAELQHEDMATLYVTKMALALQRMFPGLSAPDAKNLSLGGLQATNEFKNTISNNMTLDGQFASTNLSYSVGSKGKRCDAQ